MRRRMLCFFDSLLLHTSQVHVILETSHFWYCVKRIFLEIDEASEGAINSS